MNDFNVGLARFELHCYFHISINFVEGVIATWNKLINHNRISAICLYVMMKLTIPSSMR